MAEVSLQLPGGVEILNPVPSDPRTKTDDLATIINNPTYYIGFTPIFVESDQKTYKIVGGDATSGWVFEEAGAGGDGDMDKATYDPSNKEADAFDMDNMDESATKKIFTDTERVKLAGVEDGAEVNQSDAEIKAQYEANPDTNAYTDAEKSKLANLESSKFLGEYTSLAALESAYPNPPTGSYGYVDGGIGQDVQKYLWDTNDTKYVLQLGESTAETPASIKSKYESNPDTNAYTDSEKSKLAGIEAGAEVNDMASEIVGADGKTIPNDGDVLGLVDSEDTNLLKQLSWLNLKAALKTFFDGIYSTFSGSYNDLSDQPDLTVYAEKSNVLELDNTDVFTPDSDYEPATKKYVDDNAGGAGGHTIQDNGDDLPARTYMDVEASNGESFAIDDDTNDKTIIRTTIQGQNDFDPTGKQAGDVVTVDPSNIGFNVTSSKPDDKLFNNPEPAESDVELNTHLPAGYRIVGIAAEEYGGASAGNISIGSTALGNDIVNAEAVGANLEVDFTVLKTKFSNKNDTSLFVSSSAWGTGKITLYFTLIRDK